MRRNACRVLPFLGVLVLAAPYVLAHDVPNRFFDRAVQVVVDSERIYVLYDLSISELTLAEELMSLIGTGQLSSLAPDQWLQRFAVEMAPLLAEGVVVRVDGREIRLRPSGENHDVFEGHPRFRFRFAAELPPWGGSAQREIQVEDTNFFLERGAVRLALAGEGGVEVVRSSAARTVDEIRVRPDWELTPEEADALRRAVAVVRKRVPGDSGRDDERRNAAVVVENSRSTSSASEEREPRWSLGGRVRQLLAARSATSLLGALFIAFVFGAAHALTPGHGKTVSAAFLVAGRGRVAHALALAGTVVVAHTGSIFAAALVLAFVSPALDAWFGRMLTLLSGALLIAVGAILLVDRLGIRRRAAQRLRRGSLTWLGVVSLGIAAGIVPCWDAVALMLWALAVGRAAWGLLLLLAFALGLATVLVGIAVVAVRIPYFVERRTGSLERAGRYIAIAAAMCITAVGIWLVMNAVSAASGVS